MNNFPGVIDDPRSEDEKAKDYHHDELGSGSVESIVWKEKSESEWKRYTVRDQNGSSSCGGNAGAKALETFTKEMESSHPIYRSRSNFPSQGMWLQDIGRVCKNMGTTLESLDSSQKQTEAELNRPVSVLTPVKIGNYILVNPRGIDIIAQIIRDQGNCIFLVHGNMSEYNGHDVPVSNGLPVDFGHFVCAVDYFLYKGEKAFLIEDSWGRFGQFDGQRIFTESYVKARIDGAMYFLPSVPIVDDKPHHTFISALGWGMKGSEVKALQEMLRYEKFFLIEPTGNFFNMTANCLKKWQIKHDILDFAHENNLKKIRFGTKSIKLANILYSV